MSKYSKIDNIQWHLDINLLSETNTRQAEINHVRTCPSVQKGADDE